MDVEDRIKKRKLLLVSLGSIVLLAILYYKVIVPHYNYWGSTEAERQMDLPDADFIPDPKMTALHAITIDAPPAEVWKWLVQVGGYRAGWYSYTWAENLFGMGIYNKYELRPEWQTMEKGQLLIYNKKRDCSVIVDVVPEKYFAQRFDSTIPDDWGTAFYPSTGKTVELHNWDLIPKSLGKYDSWVSWVLYIKELPEGKSRLISRMYIDWSDHNPIVNFGMRTAFTMPHSIMDIEMLKQLKDCAEGKASDYENTPLPPGGIH